MNKIKVLGLIMLFFIVSCKSTNGQSDKILKPIKIGLNINKSKALKDYNIKLDNSSDNLKILSVDGKNILKLTENDNKNYLFEVFNETHLIISEYSNIEAGGTQQMKRVKLLLLELNSPDKIYIADIDSPIYLSINEPSLINFKNSSLENHIYSISNIEEEKLILKSVDNNEINLILNTKELGYKW